jgi:tetraacyldisaccharide 4'-kinase
VGAIKAPAGSDQVRYAGLFHKIFKLVLADDRRSAGVAILRTLAVLLSWIYGRGIKIRNLLFDFGILKVQNLDCRVISVGNLVVGGTGKTPMVIWLAKLLSAEGWRVAIVSRGYRREHPERLLVVSDGKHILVDSSFSGDEPQLMARRLPAIPVICCARRALAVEEAISQFNSEVVILDDGFQHRFLARDLDIVMLDAGNPFGSGHLFPRGIMREQATALSRAQVLVLTRFDDSLQTVENRENLARRWPDKPIFTATHSPVRLFEVATGREQPLSFLRNMKAAAFAGIERPDDFFRTLIDLGVNLVYTQPLSDHRRLTRELLETLLEEAGGLEAEIWVATEKDWVRLPDALPVNMNLWVLAIDMDLGEARSRFGSVVVKSLALDGTTPRNTTP